jgi:hypothetical protein
MVLEVLVHDWVDPLLLLPLVKVLDGLVGKVWRENCLLHGQEAEKEKQKERPRIPLGAYPQ